MIFETNVKYITDSLFDDIQKMLIEKAIKDYAKLKCKELLEIVAEKALIEETYVSPVDGTITNRFSYAFGAENTEYIIDYDSILNAVNLDEFIK